MKKIIALCLTFGLVAVYAQAADNCGCAATDVTCVNNCTLTKISNLRKNLESKKAAAKEKVNAAKQQKADNNAQLSDEIKAKAQAKKEELKAQAKAKADEAKAQKEQAKKDAAAKKAEAKADAKAQKAANEQKVQDAKANVKAKKAEVKKTVKDAKNAFKNEQKAWKELAK